MNYIFEVNKFLNNEKLGLYFSNEKKAAIVKFACWLFENEQEQIPTCAGCGAEKIDGNVTTHFHFCPEDRGNR